jgi:hypothetical protein
MSMYTPVSRLKAYYINEERRTIIEYVNYCVARVTPPPWPRLIAIGVEDGERVPPMFIIEHIWNGQRFAVRFVVQFDQPDEAIMAQCREANQHLTRMLAEAAR